MTPIEKLAWKKAQSSLPFNGECYEIAVPWKDDQPQLPTNSPMAKKRLKSVEQKLLRDNELARAYQAKMLIQQAWLEAIEWDDSLPSHLITQWRQWFNEARGVEQIKIPRCLKLPEQVGTALTLHAFTDTSEKAYTATVYSRHVSPDGRVTVRLVASKT
ncbi:Hypothetical predicted protein [Paramuricea clavata]|uniref:Uncharacterized protein n=1 Tax=Paramuricea clavata TaxID=317549 RepID=A0A7D9HTR2_PARCT|nr:Hypothetical predicted protein [Paramuricea clavata]